jgi:hypothetical protein
MKVSWLLKSILNLIHQAITVKYLFGEKGKFSLRVLPSAHLFCITSSHHTRLFFEQPIFCFAIENNVDWPSDSSFLGLKNFHDRMNMPFLT